MVELRDGVEFPDEIVWQDKSMKKYLLAPAQTEQELNYARALVFTAHAYETLGKAAGINLKTRRYILVRNSKGEVWPYHEANFSKENTFYHYSDGITPRERMWLNQAQVLGSWFEDRNTIMGAAIRRTDKGSETAIAGVSPDFESMRSESLGFLGRVDGVSSGDRPKLSATQQFFSHIPYETFAALENDARSIGVPTSYFESLKSRYHSINEALKREAQAAAKTPLKPLPKSVTELPRRAEDIIPDLLDRLPELGPLYNRFAGVREGYSIGEHTLRVLQDFERQLPHFSRELESMNLGVAKEHVQPLLRSALALHDIGKSKAVLKGNPKRQHEFTTPILNSALERLGFNPHEIALARALLGHDLIGEYIQGNSSRSDVLQALQRLAKSIHVDANTFSRLQTRIYMLDSGSYPYLNQGLYETLPTGERVSHDPRLLSLIRAPAHAPSPETLRRQRAAIMSKSENGFEELFKQDQGDYAGFVKRLEASSSSEIAATRIRQLSDEEVDIRIHTRPDALESILEQGYLNRSEGGKGTIQSGLYNKQVDVESSLLGVSPSEFHHIAAENRPHYGLIGPKLKPGETQTANNTNLPPGYLDQFSKLQESYGPVTLILDPREYRDALTLYPGDSANSFQTQLKAMTQDDFRWRKAENWGHLYVPWKFRMSLAPLIANSNGTWTPRPSALPSGYNYPAPFEGINGRISYIEAQIWGPVHKVSAIEVFTNNVTPNELEKIRKIARKFGLPVRTTNGYFKTEVLGPGN